ncbi:MAG: ABC transporter substrate-binding protein [Chromatiales bacterium]|nr:ABC transporter substrate-binding protein [Gammaproteobacteria bacterium]MCP5352563.1 ABC transporter substrate-binding protein [Chromatiales bacterium]
MKHLLKTLTLSAATALVLSASAHANPYYGGGGPAYGGGYAPGWGGYAPQARPQPAPQAAPQMVVPSADMSPEDMLRTGVTALQTFLSTGNPNDQQMALGFLREQVANYFDFAYMSRWVAGGAWKRMNAEQRAELENGIKNQFLNTLASGIGGYQDSRVEVGNARQGSSTEVVVPVRATMRGGQSVTMEFRFYKGREGWRIFDVKANGMSAVIHYRREFQKMLRGG